MIEGRAAPGIGGSGTPETDVPGLPQLRVEPCRAQPELPAPPYDRWVNAGHDDSAYFHRGDSQFIVRFPGIVDFHVAADGSRVSAFPVPDAPQETVVDLFHNAIVPLTDNHRGALSLHGSAALCERGALSFIGQSRSGKTTLAAAFAAQGHPFITEDIIRLGRHAGGYEVFPTRPLLRLFGDSAAYLTGGLNAPIPSGKTQIAASESLPFSSSSVPLRAHFLLEKNNVSQIEIERIGASQAIAMLLQHAFILDVEDKLRLEAHFQRIGLLAETIPCFRLDYPRTFAILPEVVEAIIKRAEQVQ